MIQIIRGSLASTVASLVSCMALNHGAVVNLFCFTHWDSAWAGDIATEPGGGAIELHPSTSSLSMKSQGNLPPHEVLSSPVL